jgi:ABC-2 type transport system permease protein
MKQLLAIELYKLARQPRTWLTFALMSILLFLINLGMAIDGRKMFDMILQPLSEQFIISGNLMNGHLISYLALNMLWVHIPVILVIVTGDIVSGEFESGTIRLVLCSTQKRWQWLAAKIIAAYIFVIVFMVFSGLLMVLPANFIFGTGDLLVLNEGIQIIEEKEVFKRFVEAMLFGTLGMFTFTTVSVFFSVIFRNSLAAILASLGVLIVSTLIQTFGMGIFESWQPLLFTWHMAQWQRIFVASPDLNSILQSAAVLALHITVLTGVALYRFNQMKITE